MVNYDEELLKGLRVNPAYNEPILHQVLRIAVYDEFHAFETYNAVIQKFGSVYPFVNIVEAEQRHYAELIPLFEKYGVEIPVNNWVQQIELPDMLVECCEIGVAAEVDNILMYNNLLQYTQEADIKDTLYRLQAASYNNHLPAFRQCVSTYYGNSNMDQVYNSYSSHNTKDPIIDIQNLLTSIMNGQTDPQSLIKHIQNFDGSFIGGVAAGGFLALVLSQFNTSKKSEENNA